MALLPTTRFTTAFKPLTQITPTTFRDGYTFLDLYENLRKFLEDVLTPELDSKLAFIYEQTQAEVDRLTTEMSVSVAQWQGLFDAFMANVTAELEALNDQAAANLANNPLSSLGVKLRELFALRTARNPINYVGTDNQRLIFAVADAFTSGVPVEISEKLAVTGNIPNYWNVFPTGTGSITREGYTFEVTPRPTPTVHTNNLFVNSFTGSDTNDGLSPAHAFKSLWAAYTNVLRRLTAEQAAGAKWVVNIVGTLTRGHTMSELPNFPHNLVFQGEPLVGGEPVTTIQMGDDGSRIGLWIEPGIDTIHVNNLVFKNFIGGASGYAVLMKRKGYIQITDCRAVNCETGFAGINGTDITAIRCKTDSNTPAAFLCQYNGSASFQYCEANGAGNYGYYVSRNSIAHIDYCHANDCVAGVVVDMAARANVLQSHLRRNGIGVKVSGAAEWINASSNFYIGTADANTVNYSHYGAGRETRMYSQTARNEFMVGNAWSANASYGEDKEHTGTTANTPVYVGTALGELPNGFFDSRGKRLRVEVYGASTRLTANATVSLYAVIDGSPTLVQSAPLTTNTNTWGFKLEFSMWAVNMNQQKTGYALTVFDGSRARFENAALNMGVGNVQFRLYAQLGNAGDAITFNSMETFLQG